MRTFIFEVSALAVLLGTGSAAVATKAGVRDSGAWLQEAQTSQRPGPPGTIRVRVLLIPVDVVVTDDHDRPVTDLKREDFQVFENGRLQQIRHFSVQSYSPEAPPPPAPSGIRISRTVEATPQKARTFLLLLGRGRHQQALKAVDALISFVRDKLLPQDRVAVYAYNRATDFTTDREQIVQVLEQYKKVSERIESWLELNLSGFRRFYGAKQLPKSLLPEVARIFEGTNTASRQVPPGRLDEEGRITREWDRAVGLILGSADRATETGLRMSAAENPASAALLAFDQLGGDAITLGLPFDEFIDRAGDTIQDQQNIFTCIEYLRYVEGEKHLLYFSGQGMLFPYGNTDYDKGIAAVANDARVAIDTFHTSGLSPTVMSTRGGSPFTWADTASIQSLRTVSALTGGQTSIYEDIGKSLDQLDQNTRSDYLLGYYPADENWNGKYRQITVKVNRPGMKVYSRRGYFARDRLQPYDREEFLAYSRITAAGGWADIIDDVPFKVSTSRAPDEAGERQLKVDLSINAGKLAFASADGLHSGRLRVAVFYADGGGRMLGDIWKTVTLQLQEPVYRDFLKSGIPFSVTIPARTSAMYVTIVVYDVIGDRVGSRRVSVQRLFAP